MDDKAKAAIVGFNFTLMGYVLVRALPSIFGRLVIDGNWMFTNLLVGAALGFVVAAVIYVVIGQLQK